MVEMEVEISTTLLLTFSNHQVQKLIDIAQKSLKLRTLLSYLEVITLSNIVERLADTYSALM